MLSDDQKEDMRQMGERFYGSIDMDKYRPRPAEELKHDDWLDPQHHEKILFVQLQRAMDSGLRMEDLDDEERALFEKYSIQ